MFPNYGRPNLSTLRQQTRAAFAAQISGADMTLRRSVLGVIADVLAGLINLLFGFLDYLVLQVFASTADWDGLLIQGAEYGLTPKLPTQAAGNVVLTGVSGSTIPIPINTPLVGQVLVNGAVVLVQLQTTAAADMTGGTVTIPAQAVTAGSAGNLAPNAPLTLAAAIAGVNAAAAVDGNGFAGGADAETITSFRSRVLARKQKPPQGGIAYDYETWALECAGVTRAWALPQNRGPGTIDVAFVMDGQDPITPDDAQITVVQDYIDGHTDANGNAVGAPVTDDCEVFAPALTPVNFRITGLPAGVQPAVQAALTALLATTQIAGGLSFQDQMIPTIAGAAGGNSFELVTPSADIAGVTGHLLTIGTFTWV